MSCRRLDDRDVLGQVHCSALEQMHIRPLQSSSTYQEKPICYTKEEQRARRL